MHNRQHPADETLTHRQIMTIISGLMLGMLLASLDQTIVATASRTIGDDLNDLSDQAWITTAFLVASTVTIRLFGKLSDMYGRKPFFMSAIAIFVGGSVLCGLAQTMYQLAAFRAVQGVGAGGLVPIALAILGDILAPRERARYQGYFTGLFAFASVFGPIVGGFFASRAMILGTGGWRWIFFMNVPLGVLALVVVNAVLRLRHVRREHRIDCLGAAMLIVTLVPLLIVCEQGRRWGWLSSDAGACYALAVAGLAAFVATEVRRGDEAMIPLAFFRDPVFRVGALHSFFMGIGMFGGIVSIPLYLQIVKGASPTRAGLLVLPLALGIMASTLAGSYAIARSGRYRSLPIIGSAAMACGFFAFTTIRADSPLWRADVFMLAIGAGLGLSLQPVIIAMQNSVDPSHMGVATSTSTSFRQIGGTLGTAILLSILFTTAKHDVPVQYRLAAREPAFAHALAAHPEQRHILEGRLTLDDTSFVGQLNLTLARPFRIAFTHGLDITYAVAGGLAAAALLIALLLRERPLRTPDELRRLRAHVPAAVDPQAR